MTTFYAQPDLWLWPFTINAANKKIKVTEAKGTLDETTFTVSLDESSSFIGRYYATALTDPVLGNATSGLQTTSILNGANDSLTLAHFYEAVVDKLTAESAAQKTNSLTYQLQSATPTGSDFVNSGLTITTDKQNKKIELDFGVADSINPALLGFGRDKSDTTANALEITAPFSRWGSWYSPPSGHDKREQPKYESFSASKNPRSKKWRYSERIATRPIRYVQVAGAHVWADDRASRSAAADRAGLPDGDNNNALIDLWEHVNFDDRDVIVVHEEGHGSGRGELDSGFDAGEKISVGRVDDVEGNFKPQDDQNREYAGEQYDLEIMIAEPIESAYDTANIEQYQH